jgi:hypothetical protein
MWHRVFARSCLLGSIVNSGAQQWLLAVLGQHGVRNNWRQGGMMVVQRKVSKLNVGSWELTETWH